MKIEWTQEQIEQLTSAAEAKLVNAFNVEKAKLEKKLQQDIEKLKGKFKTIDVHVETEDGEPVKAKAKGKRAKIDNNKLNELLAANKSIDEIAEYFGTSPASIRSKMYNMKKGK